MPRSGATTLARMRLGTSSLAMAAAAVALAGCGEKDKDPVAESTPTPQVKVIQPGAPGEPSREVVATPTPEGQDGHTKADIEFMQGMIHHHQQAVVMTEWVPDRTQSTSLRLMAKPHRGLPGRRDEPDAQLAQEARRGPQRPLAPPHGDARHGQLTPAREAQGGQGRRVRPPVPALHDPAPPGRADDGPGARRQGRRRARARSASSSCTWIPISRSRSSGWPSWPRSSEGGGPSRPAAPEELPTAASSRA